MVSMADRTETIAANFNAIRISIASPEQIKGWSHGEVTKPETINYRTLRPEKDGLFCERLFGPTKDWECFCGKYKRIRYRGVVCDRCGVEVTRAKVRRERMGHISLAAPVAHIWFSKTNPSRLGLLLDLSPRNLERVLYFAQHIIIAVDETARDEAIEAARLDYDLDTDKLRETADDDLSELRREEMRLDSIVREYPCVATKGGIVKRTPTSILVERPILHRLDEGAEVLVKDGQEVEHGTVLAGVPATDEYGVDTYLSEVTSDSKGRVEIFQNGIQVTDAEEYQLPQVAEILVKDGETVEQDQHLFRTPESVQLSDVQRRQGDIGREREATEKELDTRLKAALDDLNDIQKMKLLAESRYRDLSDRYPYVFKAGMGAEAILEILSQIDLEAMRDQLINDMHSTSGQRRQKAIKRLRVVESFRQSGGPRGDGPGEGSRVENMILTMMPVLPPELRPMVQLDGGRFATSDLNDLYRRVINRNNRLKRLMSLGAPEIIIRNEKRMLQEAVDALIDNGRRGRPIQGSHNHKLKSLSDLLRGKQGRFRQNLLGKRVDYSGRSVIVVGPELKMDECGLPRRMALELFKPFVMHRLVMLGIAPNIKNAKRMVERARGEVWDILEEVIKNRPVLLNRAPTLHRLGIQAFKPKLIDGNAIQIHPLVCSAFNADFDGDQMAVHVPLSSMAVLEARETMLSTHNMLSPASGDPLVAPTLDMVMGCYYLTGVDERPDIKGQGRKFYDIKDAREAYADGNLDLRAPIRVRRIRGAADRGSYFDTTLGRLIFNEILPDKFVNSENLEEATRIQNKLIDRKALNELTADLYRELSNDETAEVLDSIKNLGFEYATSSGITIAINDIQVSPKKTDILAATESLVDQYNDEYQMGLISEEERYGKTIDAWAQAAFQTAELVGGDTENFGGVGIMALSGTKGNTSQINQMAGMRGLINRPRSGVIELPVKSNFREGLSPLEYFISTHGARKGLTDTALNTASSGYLTRRLVDIAQEVIVQGEDCGTLEGWVPRRPAPHTRMTLQGRVVGRKAAMAMANPETGEILVGRNETITLEKANELVAAGVTEIMVRSPLTCAALRGVCQMCYGDLVATGQLVQEGQAVGIIAAQSIGEPGTQLTMRVFHTGGVRRTHSREDELDLQKARDMQAFVNRVRSWGDSINADIEGPIVRALDSATLAGRPLPTRMEMDRFSQELDRFRDYGQDLPSILNRFRAGAEGYLSELQAFRDTFPVEDEFYRPNLERMLRRVSPFIASEEFSRIQEIGQTGISVLDALFIDQYALPKDAEIAVLGNQWVKEGDLLYSLNEYHPILEGREVLMDDGEWVEADTILASHRVEQHSLPDQAEVLVDNDDQVEPGMVLANIPDANGQPNPITAHIDGRVKVTEDAITVTHIAMFLDPVAQISGRVKVTDSAILVAAPPGLSKTSGWLETFEGGIRVIRVNGEAVRLVIKLAQEWTQELSEVSLWVQDFMVSVRDNLQTIAGQLREDVEMRNLDITGGLPLVEEIFEARIPKNAAIVSDMDGTVELEGEENIALRVINREEYREEYPLTPEAQVLVANGEIVDAGHPMIAMYNIRHYDLPEGAEVKVDDGEQVAEGTMLASVPVSDDTGEPAADFIQADATGIVNVSADYITVSSEEAPITADVAGRVEIGDSIISIIWEDEETREYTISAAATLMVGNGDQVNAGDALTSGNRNPHDILRIQGKENLQKRMIDQVQAVYQSQGVSIHDKHIEIILRQMLRRVQVREPGDTEFIPGEVVDKFAFQEQVERVLAEGGEPATAEQVLLGVTRASLRTDSFLSAASFQETTRVLTEAAVRGQQDYLLGLKENVIIGRLIPAQVEIPGMAELLKPPPAFDLAAMAPGGWLRGPAPGDSESDAAGLNLFAPDTDDDGFERMAQAVARTYAREDDDEEEDDFFDDDDDDDDETDAAVAPATEE